MSDATSERRHDVALMILGVQLSVVGVTIDSGALILGGLLLTLAVYFVRWGLTDESAQQRHGIPLMVVGVHLSVFGASTEVIGFLFVGVGLTLVVYLLVLYDQYVLRATEDQEADDR